MPPFIRNAPYTGPIQAVILDWAGTTVDYGCMGPAAVFVEAFRQFDIAVSVSQARRFMGLEKKDHIRKMMALPEIQSQWRQGHGENPDEAAVEAVYRKTEPMMVAAVSSHGDIIDGTLDLVGALQQQGIKIGTSTGYTRPMIDVLAPLAAQNGYRPDAVVCATDVPMGRPYPWMCFLNAIRLEVYPMEAMVKIGDTISDVEEGLNAGMWTIGLIQSGNELGMTAQEVQQTPSTELDRRLSAIQLRYEQCGAHYVAAGIWECLPLINAINRRLARGERP